MAFISSQAKYKSKLIIETDPSMVLDTLAKKISNYSDTHILTGTDDLLNKLGKENLYNFTDLIALGDDSSLFDLTSSTSSIITTAEAILIAELLGSMTGAQARDLYERYCPFNGEISYRVFKKRNSDYNRVRDKLKNLIRLFPELSDHLIDVFKFE